MLTENINLGAGVVVDPSSSINNIKIGNNVKIAKGCSVFGSAEFILHVGESTYIGPHSFIQGYAAAIEIGNFVSIAQHVNIMSSSGPNASPLMQKYFPIVKKNVKIGDHSWIGANAVIMPGVILGKFCVVAANSFVNNCFDDFSVVGGNPARLIKKLDPEIVSL
ncbi:acyltransferase [Hymenobacter oligotrophus]|uniref:Acyltransferase n=1 Tax=Hymenobacter oligotrophus TaxID=2319843 RepID=A0A3B7RD52_9BACT|nr:acyltransferase [Hymenobacter oligotrophus]AYA37196.1 acyltransferase [Hymenobacter oligotrophus]